MDVDWKVAWRTMAIAVAAIALLIVGVLLFFPREGSPETLRLGALGAQVDLPGEIAGEISLEERTQQGLGTVLHAHFGEGCELGVFYAIRKSAIASSRTSWTRATLEKHQAPEGEDPARVKAFTDFYLVFEPSQAPCSEDASAIERGDAARRLLWESLASARYIEY